MSKTPSPYGVSLQLLTDFYQLTMAYASWRSGRTELQTIFNLSFRSNPFGSGFTVLAGLEQVIQYLDRFQFTPEDLSFLAGLKSEKNTPLFEPEFLEFLRGSQFECDVDAIVEGKVVFPHEPVFKVRGPLWQCQWIETALLNIINFQSLIATKTARICVSAKGKEVVEMGLRRAQGFDGALSGSRAAYLGGASSTSNLLASQMYGIPLRGTHAHSWIMSFEDEEEAFQKYADAFPDHCILLVDTYDTLKGVENAIRVGKRLKKQGHRLLGIRLDSGDFAYLSQAARRRLDEEGLSDTKIVASNELDEHLIQSLQLQDAKVDVWGVGTRLITAQEQPAMSGVYKLCAVMDNGRWVPRIKISDQPAKTSIPGDLKIRRYTNAEQQIECDLIFDNSESQSSIDRIIDPLLPLRHKKIHHSWKSEELLIPIYRGGKRVYECPTLADSRATLKQELDRLHNGHKRLENPHIYPVGISPMLSELRTTLIQQRLDNP